MFGLDPIIEVFIFGNALTLIIFALNFYIRAREAKTEFENFKSFTLLELKRIDTENKELKKQLQEIHDNLLLLKQAVEIYVISEVKTMKAKRNETTN